MEVNSLMGNFYVCPWTHIFRYFDISGLVEGCVGNFQEAKPLERCFRQVILICPHRSARNINYLSHAEPTVETHEGNGRTFRMILADHKNSFRSSRCRTISKAVINSRPAWSPASRSRREAIYLSFLLY